MHGTCMYISYSRTSIIRPSIYIRNLDYPAWKSSKLKKGRVSSCYHGRRNVRLLRMRIRPHSLLLVGGSRCGLSNYSVIWHGKIIKFLSVILVSA